MAQSAQDLRYEIAAALDRAELEVSRRKQKSKPPPPPQVVQQESTAFLTDLADNPQNADFAFDSTLSDAGDHKGAGRSATPKLSSRSKGSRASRRRKAHNGGAIAGYRPPNASAGDEFLKEARAVCKSDMRLEDLLDDQLTLDAAVAVGVKIGQLKPKPPSYFQREKNRATILPEHVQKRRFEHFEERRAWKLALVLQERDRRVKLEAEDERKRKEDEEMLLRTFDKVYDAELRRTQKIDQSAAKVRNVLIRENDILLDRREAHLDKAVSAAEREMRARIAREQQAAAAREQAENQQRHIARIQQQKEERMREAQQSFEVAMQQREEKLRRFREAKQQEVEELKEQRERRRQEMMAVRDKVLTEEQQRRSKFLDKLAKVEENRRQMEQDRKDALARRKEEKRLQFEAKMENAERVRNVAAARKAKAVEKMQRNYRRMEHMRLIQSAIQKERQLKWKTDNMEKDYWQQQTLLERSRLPGPGEYEPKSPEMKGGAWGKHKVKSDIEWQIERAKRVPGPGQYSLPTTMANAGGTWGKYSGKSDVEWKMYHAARMPGPGDYEPAEPPRGFSVTFGEFNAPSDLDLQLARANDTPGPVDYAPPVFPNEIPKLKTITSAMVKKSQELSKSFTFCDTRNSLDATAGNRLLPTSALLSKPKHTMPRPRTTQSTF